MTTNGTAEVFSQIPDYGLSVTYEYKNEVHENLYSQDYINAQWVEPITKISFSKAWFDQTTYDEIKTFYQGQNGSVGVFLIEDPIDYYAFKDGYNTTYGIVTQGLVVNDGINWRLAKNYILDGTYTFTRFITRPKENTITVYSGATPQSVVIDYDTGIITSGGSSGLTWEGYFYLPVRFENDTLPLQIIGYDEVDNVQTYSMPDLRMVEVKELDISYSQNLAVDYSHSFAIPIELNTNINTYSKNDIYISSSGFEQRDDLSAEWTEIQVPTQLLDFKKKEYLIGLWKLTLGNFASFDFQDAESVLIGNYRFKESITFRTVLYEDLGNHQLFEIDGIVLKEDNSPIRSTYCHAILIEREDGLIFASTNHDKKFTYATNDYEPNIGFDSNAPARTGDLNTDSNEVISVFKEVDETELISGQFNNATIQQFIYDWFNNTLVASVFRGTVGGFSIGYLPNRGKQYKLEFFSTAEKLDVEISIRTSSECRHEFLSQGIGKCNRPIDASVQKVRTIESVSPDGILIGFSSGQDWVGYSYGTCEFTSGAAKGSKIYIKFADSSPTFKLLYAPPVLPSPGDSVVVTKPCNKTVAACQNYLNLVNYGGFPELPGIDLAVATAE